MIHACDCSSPLPEASTTTNAAEYTEEEVAEFLKSIGLAQYVKKFLENEVNGGMMSIIKDEELEELGVQSQLHKIKILVLFKRHLTRKTCRLGISLLIRYSTASIHVITSGVGMGAPSAGA